MSNPVVAKVIVVVDLSRYSDICRELEQQLDVTAVAALNQQVSNLISLALAAAGIRSDALPYKSTGDGAIIALDRADQAAQFAEKLHLGAENHNRGKDVPLAQRHFRVGVWKGEIVLQPKAPGVGHVGGFDFAGTAISNAVRLEGACKTGEVLLSSDTWADLPAEAREQYGPEEEVKGKRSESFKARRRRVTPAASWDDKPERASRGGSRASSSAKPNDLIGVHNRRLQILEKQAAMFGALTPPHITMEIADIKRILSELEQ